MNKSTEIKDQFNSLMYNIHNVSQFRIPLYSKERCKEKIEKIKRLLSEAEELLKLITPDVWEVPEESKPKNVCGSLHGRGSRWPDKWSRGYEGH